MLIDANEFERKLRALSESRLKGIDEVHTLDVYRDVAKMYYQAGINEAKAALVLSMMEEVENEK